MMDTLEYRLTLAMSKGVKPRLAIAYAVASYITELAGGLAPNITSGARSIEYQRELYRRWKAGEPGIYRPARRSWHTVGWALDVNTKGRGFSTFRGVMKALGARWGGDFSKTDPPHFDMPQSPDLRQAAY